MSCTHLTEARAAAEPAGQVTQGCQDCLAEGYDYWVHLRLCLACGHVGCCDSSPRRHATAHFEDTGHPVIRSFQPGEAWRWCYVDSVVG
ncbi:MAG TPA: UBP-type zinc finger domain-containing protein [Kribbellaceae bacterium]|nr:UBP-type zinc finger domain-containing protein [Kribbellaceae bacterium]